MGVEGTATVVS